MLHFQAGTLEAFDLLVERYRHPLLSFLYRFVGEPAACEDLLQETFLRVYRNRFSYRRIARFSTWLYTIAGNLGRSEYRRRKRHRFVPLRTLSRDDAEYELLLPADALSPEGHAHGALLARYLQDALRRLPDEFQEVVVLRDVQELSYEEIAEVTALPMGTVKSRIHRGRLRLQELLGDLKG
jgi:RNA polymerase sigma-70 factor (ECF subfamily)